MDILSKSEYAAARGWSKPYVSKLAKAGRLVITSDGKVDVAATDALLADTSDPSKAGVAERHERDRVEKGVSALVRSGSVPTEPSKSSAPDFQKARAHREHYLALLAEDEYRKQHGQLAEVGAIENAAFATGRMLRDLLLGLPKQISPELAALTDPWEVERLLTTGIRRVLEDAERVSASDLENALKPAN
ncbi:MAG: terminase small subunit [Pseudomonas sp.]